jgi:biotin/methionine sulfoxide reductase
MNDSLGQEMDQAREDWSPHSAHWGAFSARWNGATLDISLTRRTRALLDPAELHDSDAPQGPHPAADGAQGVAGPEQKPARSFDQKFVACPWDEVLDLLANELSRIRTEHGAAAVFGGSYGWSSAGRFHHAQSQVHRFLNTAFGGYVRSVNSYSAGASAVILPHILGSYEPLSRHNVTWDQVAEHSDTCWPSAAWR